MPNRARRGWVELFAAHAGEVAESAPPEWRRVGEFTARVSGLGVELASAGSGAGTAPWKILKQDVREARLLFFFD